MFSNVLYNTYLGWSGAHDTPLSRRTEFFNEIGLQIAAYHLALFPLLSLDLEEKAGYSMIGVVAFVFMVNLGIILVMSIQSVKRKLYLSKLKKGFEQKMKEKKEILALVKVANAAT